MAANISTKNGRHEAFTALTPAWWDSKKEYMADKYLTSEQVFGERGLLNFEYELRPMLDAATHREIPSYRHCVRKDTEVTVGCGMTDRYQIVQPREAFAFLDDLMRDGIMKYASAGVLGRGEELWILGVIPEAKSPIAGEHHKRYVLWTDRFDGTACLKCFPCVTRVECANTLAIAMGEHDERTFQSIRHSGDMQSKLEAARQTLLTIEDSFQQYNADCLKLISAKYSRPEAKEYINTLFPEVGDDASTRAKNQREQRIQEVRNAMVHPSNKLGEMIGTWYQLANAVTFAVDHGNVFRFKGDNQKSNKFRSLMTGPGAELKRQAFNTALEMAG